ncbi:MAG: hypothetical protein LJE84_04140 [Gammaproteobacteria bacterium]|jgi:hypothetical protein|nr:hypothetical protein [Gammaproteobacteria bacterium]
MTDDPLGEEPANEFDEAAAETVELGNRLVEANEDADERDVAAGLLAGAIQFWLFSCQPCADPMCESCADLRSAESRLRLLLDEVSEFATESDYFHSRHDHNVGNA